jgi:hypothetical protein
VTFRLLERLEKVRSQVSNAIQMIDMCLQGSYGEVYLGKYLEAEVAMKRLKDMEDVKAFERELSLLRYSRQRD